jgi:hypothetical protein
MNCLAALEGLCALRRQNDRQQIHLGYRQKSTSVTTALETKYFCDLKDQQV